MEFLERSKVFLRLLEEIDRADRGDDLASVIIGENHLVTDDFFDEKDGALKGSE